jgi:hypothetical protein
MTKAELEKIIEYLMENDIQAYYYNNIAIQVFYESMKKAGLITGTCKTCKHGGVDKEGWYCDIHDLYCRKDFYCTDWQGVEK